jgi:hypothetical protein
MVRIILGIILIILALGICLFPLFTNCYAQGRVLTLQNGKTLPMKCYWSAQAEMVVSAPLLAVGILMIISRRRESMMDLSILGIVLGASSLAIPTILIGVCATATMVCRTLMTPVLLTLGSLTIIVSIIGLVYSLTAQAMKDK